MDHNISQVCPDTIWSHHHPVCISNGAKIKYEAITHGEQDVNPKRDDVRLCQE